MQRPGHRIGHGLVSGSAKGHDLVSQFSVGKPITVSGGRQKHRQQVTSINLIGPVLNQYSVGNTSKRCPRPLMAPIDEKGNASQTGWQHHSPVSDGGERGRTLNYLLDDRWMHSGEHGARNNLSGRSQHVGVDIDRLTFTSGIGELDSLERSKTKPPLSKVLSSAKT